MGGKKLSTEESKIEVAGRGFFALYEEDAVEKIAIVEEVVDHTEGDDNTFQSKAAELKSRTKTGMFKLDEHLKGKDLYKLMRVEPDASERDIRRSFKELTL